MNAAIFGFFTMLAACACSTPAMAHGGATIDKDPCVQKTGSRMVHFTVYEPEVDPSGEYCADVPKSGPMIVVFDLVDHELRSVPLDLEIVKTAEGGRETMLHVAPKSYPTGVINAEVSLTAPGRYAAILTPEGGASVVFPVRVEMGWSPLVWVGLLLLAAPPLYYWSRRRSPSSRSPSEARSKLAVVK